MAKMIPKNEMNFNRSIGEIELKDQKWYQIRLDNGNKIEMQDPMRQANNSRSFLIDLLKEIKKDNKICYVGCAVWFTSVNNSKKVDFPLHYGNRVLFKNDLENPKDALNNILNKQYKNLNEDIIKILIDKLAPEFHLIKDINSEKEQKYCIR